MLLYSASTSTAKWTIQSAIQSTLISKCRHHLSYHKHDLGLECKSPTQTPTHASKHPPVDANLKTATAHERFIVLEKCPLADQVYSVLMKNQPTHQSENRQVTLEESRPRDRFRSHDTESLADPSGQTTSLLSDPSMSSLDRPCL